MDHFGHFFANFSHVIFREKSFARPSFVFAKNAKNCAALIVYVWFLLKVVIHTVFHLVKQHSNHSCRMRPFCKSPVYNRTNVVFIILQTLLHFIRFWFYELWTSLTSDINKPWKMKASILLALAICIILTLEFEFANGYALGPCDEDWADICEDASKWSFVSKMLCGK